MGTQTLHKVLLNALTGCRPLRTRGRVQRNRVHVHPTATALSQLLTEQIRTPALIVNIANQCVLNGDATAGRTVVVVRSVQSLVDLPALVNRDELITQLIIRSVQRQRQSNGQLLHLELTNTRHQAHGRHGQTASRNTEALGRRVNQAVHSAHGCLVVSERLTHAHEDNIGNTQRTSILRTAFCFFQSLHLLQVAGTGNDLLHNFCGGQVTGQTLLTGRAEGAVHATASLRRDAHGHAVVIAHDDGLNERTVKEAVHNLQGVATVSLEGTDRGQ